MIGAVLEVHARLGSTNDECLARSAAGAPEGLVIVAEEQTGGRGRQGRPWHSPAGAGLWLSVLLRPRLAPEDRPALALLGAVAVARAVRAAHGIPAVLKWPNDVLAGGRKLAGVLCEAVGEAIVVGVGLNVNLSREAFPPDLREIATSVSAELGRDVDRAALLRGLLAEMDGLYAELAASGRTGGLIAAWTALARLGEVPGSADL